MPAVLLQCNVWTYCANPTGCGTCPRPIPGTVELFYAGSNSSNAKVLGPYGRGCYTNIYNQTVYPT